MRRNVVFDKGRDWRTQDERSRAMYLRPELGAKIGEYAPQESSEFSDSYYGPGDNYSRRDFASGGYSRGEENPGRPMRPRVGGVTRNIPMAPARHRVGHRVYGEVDSYGELRAGARSWADLGVSSVHAGESGITEEPLPSFRGRGPKSYSRSDERLTELICERLTEDPHIDASDISVAVDTGEVTLTGTVTDKPTKWRVEDVVESCGLTRINNRLRTTSAR